MGQSSSSDDRARAARLFAEFVARAEAGEEPDFEELCADYRGLADELRRQFEVHHGVRAELPAGSQDSGEEPSFEDARRMHPNVADRLRRQHAAGELAPSTGPRDAERRRAGDDGAAIHDAPIGAPVGERVEYARPLRLGEFISRTFSIYFRYAIPITLATAVLGSLILWVRLKELTLLVWTANPIVGWRHTLWHLIGSVSAAAGGYLLQGIVTFIVLQHLRGESPRGFSALGTGLRRTTRGMPTALAVALVVGGLTFASERYGTLIGIPAAILCCGWFVAVPVSVTEGGGPMAAVARSWTLTKGSKWGIFLALLLLGSIWELAKYSIEGWFDHAEAASFEGQRRSVLIHQALALPILSLIAVAAPVAYYTLRKGRDGIDVEELASVFE